MGLVPQVSRVDVARFRVVVVPRLRVVLRPVVVVVPTAPSAATGPLHGRGAATRRAGGAASPSAQSGGETGVADAALENVHRRGGGVRQGRGGLCRVVGVGGGRTPARDAALALWPWSSRHPLPGLRESAWSGLCDRGFRTISPGSVLRSLESRTAASGSLASRGRARPRRAGPQRCERARRRHGPAGNRLAGLAALLFLQGPSALLQRSSGSTRKAW